MNKVLIAILLNVFVFFSCSENKNNHREPVLNNSNNKIIERNHKTTKATFPIEKLTFYENQENLKIVCFIPSLYIDCDYASMLTTSLNHYFVKGLTFEEKTKHKIDVILLVNDKNKWENSKNKNHNKLDNLITYYDKDGALYESLGIENFEDTNFQLESNEVVLDDTVASTRNESSIVYLLDEENNIIHEDNSYRGEGEQLKALENVIKDHLKLNSKNDNTSINTLKVGDPAPDFKLNGPEINTNSSFLNSNDKIKIITFYPAPFTGIIPANENSRIENSRTMTCASQIQLLDFDDFKSSIEIYAITDSTNEILKLWKEHLKSNNVNYLNDNNYKISKLYNSYNAKDKLNNRKTYIIKNGIIQYIDDDFIFEDKNMLMHVLDDIIKE